MAISSLYKFLIPILAVEMVIFCFLVLSENNDFNIFLGSIASVFNKEISIEKEPPAAEPMGEETNEGLFSFDPLLLQWQPATDSAPWSKRDAHTALVFKDKIWLFGGVGGASPDYSKIKSDIWVSEDGQNWQPVAEKAAWGPRRAHNSFVFQDKIWILGGVTKGEKYLNDIWVSKDGLNWQQVVKNAAWTPRKGFGTVIFDNKIWLFGGVDIYGPVNDVWYSSDGINWQLTVKKAAWLPRYDLAVEVFDNKIWLSGGVFPGELGFKEIWMSADGADWQKINDKIFWRGRHGHCFFTFKNYLWLAGGWSGLGKGFNDVWFSKDGLNWLKTLQEPGWKGREDLVCLVFKDQIWMLGGMLTSGQRTNDVWYSIETKEEKDLIASRMLDISGVVPPVIN